MIEVYQLKKSFGNVHAVKNVSFQANNGSITGLLGDNGAGKTTTIRMLAGTLGPESGSIRINGELFDPKNHEQKKSMGILTDAKGLYERLSARENIEFYGRLMGLRGQALQSGLDQVIETMDLSDIIDRPVHGFSTGQRMKVLLGRLLVYKPKNIIFDEPTSGLDVRATRSLREILLKLKRAGHCLVFSSHIMQEVELLCDSVTVIHDGLTIGQATVTEWNRITQSARFEDAFVSAIEGASYVQ